MIIDHLDVADTQGGMGFFTLEEIPAEGVVLFESVFRPEGAEYHVIESFELGFCKLHHEMEPTQDRI